MRRLASILIVSIAAAMTVSMAGDADHTQIRAKYRAFEAALSKRDFKAAFRVGTSDMKWKQVGGNSLSKDQIQDMMHAGNLTTKLTGAKTKLSSIKVSGKTAVVQCLTVIRSDVPLENPKGKTGKMVSSSWSTDKWVKTGKGWFLKEVAVGKETFTIDGKPVKRVIERLSSGGMDGDG